MLPNFLIVGAAKAGTTSLYNYLRQHPDVYMSPIKEPFFFSFINEKTNFNGPYDAKINEIIITNLKEYENLFIGVNNEKAVGECSNSYLYFYEKSGSNIKQYIPDCKIVIILRNPIERAFSHYTQHRMIGHEYLSFKEAIEKEIERKKAGWRWHYQYIDQGMYYEQVKWYMEHFDHNNVKIYLFDELKNEPEKLMTDLYEFLKIPKLVNINYEKAYNQSGIPRMKVLHKMLINKKYHINKIGRILPKAYRIKIYDYLFQKNIKRIKISEEEKQYLKNIFKENIINLQNLINKDLSSWLR